MAEGQAERWLTLILPSGQLLEIPGNAAEQKLPADWTVEDMVQLREYFEVTNKWFFDMWTRSGGGNDDLSDIVDVVEGEEGATTPGGGTGAWTEPDWRYFVTS